jgi:hypothetical protein
MFVHAAPNFLQAPNPFITGIDQKQTRILDDLTWKDQYLTRVFFEWMRIANNTQVQVDKQMHKFQSMVNDQPEINHSNQKEVWLAYKTTMLNVWTSQIIRKIAKTKIKATANAARMSPEFQHIHGLINQCEKFLLDRLPPKLPQITQVETAIAQYQVIDHELKNMTRKILKKRRVV